MRTRCECGRRAVAAVRSAGPKARPPGVRRVKGHWLCPGCFRRQADRLWAERLARAGEGGG